MPAGIWNDTVTGNPSSADSTVARYEALIRVSEALRAYHDRDTLFQSLARELRPVVRFTFLGLALYDEETHTVERHVLEVSGEPVSPPELSTDESLTYWIVQHQEPLVIPDIEDEDKFPRAMAYFRNQGVRSTCSLPLTTPRRPLGMLLAGGPQPQVYDAKDVTFLALVANQVALAIDDALNYGALQESLAVERERIRNLEATDDLLRALSSVLDIRQVFPRISQIAAAVLPHDLLTLTSHNHGEVIVEATSHRWEPLPTRLKVRHLIPEGDGFGIINDLETDPRPAVEPPAFWDQIREALYVRLRKHQLA
jgi:GAF domain-containing protein